MLEEMKQKWIDIKIILKDNKRLAETKTNNIGSFETNISKSKKWIIG